MIPNPQGVFISPDSKETFLRSSSKGNCELWRQENWGEKGGKKGGKEEDSRRIGIVDADSNERLPGLIQTWRASRKRGKRGKKKKKKSKTGGEYSVGRYADHNFPMALDEGGSPVFVATTRRREGKGGEEKKNLYSRGEGIHHRVSTYVCGSLFSCCRKSLDTWRAERWGRGGEGKKKGSWRGNLDLQPFRTEIFIETKF